MFQQMRFQELSIHELSPEERRSEVRTMIGLVIGIHVFMLVIIPVVCILLAHGK